MNRSHVSPGADRKYFRNTAKTVKDINLGVGHMRGGIRL